jgi:hypothetical protein
MHVTKAIKHYGNFIRGDHVDKRNLPDLSPPSI